MDKKLTPLGEFIEWFSKEGRNELNHIVSKKAKSLLEKEKKMVVDANNVGFNTARRQMAKMDYQYETAEQYFTENFKQQ